ncbi:MAG: tRNA epoxyqueuosine(34) reductase QueG [Bacilli bacterium]
MDYLTLKKQIKKYSKRIGINALGIADPSRLIEIEEKLKLQAKLNYCSDFQKGTIEEKINPKLLMKNVQSIIVILMSYPQTCKQLEEIKDDEVYFASVSWGKDYHLVLREKLESLATFIKKEIPFLEYKITVDTEALCERTLAYRAGLGFIGKNNLLINEKFGSYVFIGTMLINIKLPFDQPLNLSCLNCNLCLSACPTGALNDNGILNANLCLAYLTQKKGALTIQEQKHFTNCIYGCDKCMQVCPYNKKNNEENLVFAPTGLEFININDYQPLTKKEFKKKYGYLSGSWRGEKVINRNIKIIQERFK